MSLCLTKLLHISHILLLASTHLQLYHTLTITSGNNTETIIHTKTTKENLNKKTGHKVEWAFSPVHLEYLAFEESKLFNIILKYRVTIQERIGLLRSYIKNYKDGTNADDVRNEEGAGNLVNNPLMMYRMFLRFADKLLENIKTHIEFRSKEALQSKVEYMKKLFVMPTNKDLHETMDNILRLQNVYELQASHLAQGVIFGKATGFGLTVSQRYEFAKYALAQEKFTAAYDWVNAVLSELKLHPIHGRLLNDAFNTLEKVVRQHDKLHDRVTDENYHRLNHNRFDTKISHNPNNLESFRRAIQREYEFFDGYTPFNFLDTCSEIRFMSPAQASELQCYLNRRIHPVWTISPLKIEIHSWDPYIAQIHDIIGEKLIHQLKKESLDDLVRSTVITKKGGKSVPYQKSSGRTSSQSFLNERNNPIFLNFEQRIGLMTGLKVDNFLPNGSYEEFAASEAIQVALYAFGGHFEEHIDAFDSDFVERETGNRIATVMFYLNDVELGGHTVFPQMRLAVAPKKGSALFWYDLMKNGEPDNRVSHGGCPVLLGRKWISNKWILNHANFQRRLCSVHPNK